MDQRTMRGYRTNTEMLHCPTCNMWTETATIERCTEWNETIRACPECGEVLSQQ